MTAGPQTACSLHEICKSASNLWLLRYARRAGVR